MLKSQHSYLLRLLWNLIFSRVFDPNWYIADSAGEEESCGTGMYNLGYVAHLVLGHLYASECSIIKSFDNT